MSDDGLVLGGLKRLAAMLPRQWHTDARRWYFRRQISRGAFVSGEPEFALLDQLVAPGDWVLDVGANVGHYTRRLSDLAGPSGRVLAFEPVPETFAMLAANAALFEHRNVTLLNVAASNSVDTVPMSIPSLPHGQRNYYQAAIASGGGSTTVLTMTVDGLHLPRPVTLAKIDVEGHEMPVLAGMRQLLERDRPVLIVETEGDQAAAFLAPMGYDGTRLPGSPNMVFRPAGNRR